MAPVLIVFVMLVLGSIVLLAGMGMNHKQKLEATRSGQSSLGSGELQQLIREAVDDAVQPLLERIEELERPALPPAQEDDSTSDKTP